MHVASRSPSDYVGPTCQLNSENKKKLKSRAAVIQATDLALRVCACCHYTTEPPYHYGLYVEVQAEYLYSLAYRHVLPVRRTS